MSNINFTNLRRELVNVLRNGNIFSLAVRGATTQTDSFTATASQTVFILTKTLVRNVRSVTVNAVAIKYIIDYTISEATNSITLNTASTVGDAVVVQYDYSASGAEKIYPDMPREDLTLNSFPRVGIEVTSATTDPFGLGGQIHITDTLITVMIWMQVNKDTGVGGGLGGTEDLINVANNIRNTIRTNGKLFSTIPYIYPMHINPITRSLNNKIIQCSVDLNGRFIVEV